MQRTILTTAALALVAGSASAEGISYTRLSYDYQAHTGALGDPTVSFLQGAIDYETGDFVLGATFDNTAVSADAGDGSFQDANIWAGYTVNPQILAGAGILNRSGDTVEATDTELFGQYVASQFGAALTYTAFEEGDAQTAAFGQYTLNEGLDLGGVFATISDVDGATYILSADYDLGAFDARAAVRGNTEVDGNVYTVRGNYGFGDSFRIGAAFETLVGTEFEDRTMQVGAGYSFVDDLWIDAGVGQVDLDDGATVDFVRVLLTYETGGRARLDHTMAQDISDDIWSGADPLFIFNLSGV